MEPKLHKSPRLRTGLALRAVSNWRGLGRGTGRGLARFPNTPGGFRGAKRPVWNYLRWPASGVPLWGPPVRNHRRDAAVPQRDGSTARFARKWPKQLSVSGTSLVCVPHPEPSSLLPPHTIPLGRPSAPAPSIQYRASNLDWRLVPPFVPSKRLPDWATLTSLVPTYWSGW